MSNVVKVKKGNRVIEIPEVQKENYLERGYDVIDKKGKVKESATGGRKVSVEEYNQMAKKLREAEEALEHTGAAEGDKKKIADLELRLEEARSQLEASQEEVKEAQSEISLLEKENERLDKEVKRHQSKK